MVMNLKAIGERYLRIQLRQRERKILEDKETFMSPDHTVNTTDITDPASYGESPNSVAKQARIAATQPTQTHLRGISLVKSGSHSQGDSVIVNEIDLISPRGVAADITYKIPSSQLEDLAAKNSTAEGIQQFDTSVITSLSTNIERSHTLKSEDIPGEGKEGVLRVPLRDELYQPLATQAYTVGALSVKHRASQYGGDSVSMRRSKVIPRDNLTQADISDIPIIRSDTPLDEIVPRGNTPFSQKSELNKVVNRHNTNSGVADSDDISGVNEPASVSSSQGNNEGIEHLEHEDRDSLIVVSSVEDGKTDGNNKNLRSSQNIHDETTKVGSSNQVQSSSNGNTIQKERITDNNSEQISEKKGQKDKSSTSGTSIDNEIYGKGPTEKLVFRLWKGETSGHSNKTTEIINTLGLSEFQSQVDQQKVRENTSPTEKSTTNVTMMGTEKTFPSSLPEKLPRVDTNDSEGSGNLKPNISPNFVSTPKEQVLALRSFGSRGSLSQSARILINPLKEIPKPWFPLTEPPYPNHTESKKSDSYLPHKKSESDKKPVEDSSKTTNEESSKNIDISISGRDSHSKTKPLSTNESQDSQRIVLNRRTLKRNLHNIKLDSNDDDTDNDTPPPKEKKNKGVFPTGVRSNDDEYLSKKDIVFQNAVWYQFDMDFNYYPGLLLSDPDYNSDTSLVKFSMGTSACKNDDLYYLDIRIGDVVSFEAQKYVVAGLECRTKSDDTIRCIRGYDTVYLQKSPGSSDIPERTVVLPLASISIELKDWVKRPKIVSGDKNSNLKSEAYETLQHPIRHQKNSSLLSPRRARSGINYSEVLGDDVDESGTDKTVHTVQSLERGQKKVSKQYMDYSRIQKKNQLYGRSLLSPPKLRSRVASHEGDSITFTENEIQTQKSSPRMLPLQNAQKTKIFNRCLFVITGTFNCRCEIEKLIETAGGKILESGFSDEFSSGDDELTTDSKVRVVNLKLKWKRSNNYSEFKFACLISEHHLRSPKYLETIALGWPTLHWKFVYDTLKNGKLSYDMLPRYLLAAGESFRLKSSESSDMRPVFKSHNIFQFYANLLNGNLLREQVNISSSIMKNFVAILYRTSELTNFVEFILSCFGVAKLYRIDSKCSKGEVVKIFSDILDECSKKKYRLLLYSNNDYSRPFDELLKTIQEEFLEKGDVFEVDYHIGSKEWLIQTIISGDTGFDE